jgi:hypothetical protein
MFLSLETKEPRGMPWIVQSLRCFNVAYRRGATWLPANLNDPPFAALAAAGTEVVLATSKTHRKIKLTSDSVLGANETVYLHLSVPDESTLSIPPGTVVIEVLSTWPDEIVDTVPPQSIMEWTLGRVYVFPFPDEDEGEAEDNDGGGDDDDADKNPMQKYLAGFRAAPLTLDAAELAAVQALLDKYYDDDSILRHLLNPDECVPVALDLLVDGKRRFLWLGIEMSQSCGAGNFPSVVIDVELLTCVATFSCGYGPTRWVASAMEYCPVVESLAQWVSTLFRDGPPVMKDYGEDDGGNNKCPYVATILVPGHAANRPFQLHAPPGPRNESRFRGSKRKRKSVRP